MLLSSQVLRDEAGEIFGKAFAANHASATNTGVAATAAAARPAYDAACTAVRTVTEPRTLDTGLAAEVQKCAACPSPSSHALDGWVDVQGLTLKESGPLCVLFFCSHGRAVDSTSKHFNRDTKFNNLNCIFYSRVYAHMPAVEMVVIKRNCVSLH